MTLVWLPPTAANPYVYDAVCVNVVDGDTQDFLVTWSRDIGFRINVTQQFELRTRSFGINTPEVNRSDSHAAGVAARDYVNWWLGVFGQGFNRVKLVTHKDATEKYGRYLAEVWSLDWQHCLNQGLLNSGNAVEYLPK